MANGGFEDVNYCTEYNEDCAPEAWIATSLWDNYYYKDAASAHIGEHFIGLVAGRLSKPGVRNFIRSRLLCGLRPGHQYRLTFYIRAAEPVFDSVGIYFSPDDFLYDKRDFRDIQPALWLTDGELKGPRDPGQWHRVQWSYTATGKEGYIVIGNFKRVDYTGIQIVNRRKEYYFFLDDISLVPMQKEETLCAQADSMRQEIYGENERHEFIRRKVREYHHPPPLPPLPKTTEHEVDTLLIPDIFFTTGSYQLASGSFAVLDSLAHRLSGVDIDSVVIEGHTDSIGTLAHNLTLSVNRAKAVKTRLVSKSSLPEALFITRGYAFLRPLADNATPEGRQRNRRVEILVYRKG